MNTISYDLTCETDYFVSRLIDGVLVFNIKGNMMIHQTSIKAKETILAFLKQAEKDGRVRVIVMMPLPRKARREEYLDFFSMVASNRLPENSVMRLFRAIDQVILHVISSDKFYISANCGQVLPMFIGASLAFDYRILGDNTAIQNPSLELGLAPKGGAPFFLSHTIGRGKVYNLLLAQKDINAEEARYMGLADRLVPMETFEKAVIEIAAKFAAMPLSSLRLVKRLGNFSISGLEAYLEYENQQLMQALHQARSQQTGNGSGKQPA